MSTLTEGFSFEVETFRHYQKMGMPFTIIMRAEGCKRLTYELRVTEDGWGLYLSDRIIRNYGVGEIDDEVVLFRNATLEAVKHFTKGL